MFFWFLLLSFSFTINVALWRGDIWYHDISTKVRPEDDEQEVEADERINAFFRKVAGDDLEIDWKELQDVLNFALTRG